MPRRSSAGKSAPRAAPRRNNPVPPRPRNDPAPTPAAPRRDSTPRRNNPVPPRPRNDPAPTPAAPRRDFTPRRNNPVPPRPRNDPAPTPAAPRRDSTPRRNNPVPPRPRNDPAPTPAAPRQAPTPAAPRQAPTPAPVHRSPRRARVEDEISVDVGGGGSFFGTVVKAVVAYSVLRGLANAMSPHTMVKEVTAANAMSPHTMVKEVAAPGTTLPDACDAYTKAFMDCASKNSKDVSMCQRVMDRLSLCRSKLADTIPAAHTTETLPVTK